MKLSNILFLAFLGTALSEQEIKEEEEPAERKQAQFSITYDVLESKVNGLETFMEFEDGQNATLAYTFTNKEDRNVSVIGVGGSVYDLKDNDIAANISATSIGPFPVEVNTTINFQQIINLILQEGDYFLSPHVYVRKEEETMKVVASPSLLRMLPPAMSFFDPKFLIVQLILLGLVGGFSYLTFARSGNKKSKVSRNRARGGEQVKTVSAWLPENHVKK